jgi:polyisoprenoid-binding protein YceI
VHTHIIPLEDFMSHTCADSPVRDVDGVELPAAGRWRIDPGHAEVGFVGRHLVFTKVRGRFRGVDGVVEIGDDTDESTVEVTIQMATVDSGDATRDEHLRSPDLFDVENFPTATFRGRARDWSGRRGSVDGELTIKGVTRPIELDVTYLGFVADPWGGERAIFSATASVNREDWGIGWNMVLDAGGLLVSKEIELELELETVREG